MNNEFCKNIWDQILDSISLGKKHFVFWGINKNCLFLLLKFKELGLLETYVVGIINSNNIKQNQTIHGIKILPPKDIANIAIDVLVITEDAGKEIILKEYYKNDKRLPQVIINGIKHLEFQDTTFYEILSSCLVKSYATGYSSSLIHIYQAIKYLSDAKIQGDVAEFGIFKGGTLTFIYKVLQRFMSYTKYKIYGFDIFEGFPIKKTIFDLYTNPKCEFKDSLAVMHYFSHDDRIRVIKGDICETYKQLENKSLMFTFFDTDNYSPTRAALELCFKQTVQGGILAFDHYISDEQFVYTIGERIAAKEFFSDKKVFNLHGSGIFIKL
jgi:O-methyltransferase